jgi:hypothetical protein
MPKKKPDRHKDHSRQYNVRVPNTLRDAFIAACASRGLVPAHVHRTLMQGFVDIVQEDAGKQPA